MKVTSTEVQGESYAAAENLRAAIDREFYLDAIQRATEILDTNQVPPRYVFIDPPKPRALRWKAGVWGAP